MGVNPEAARAIERDQVLELLEDYDLDDVRIATVGSHSALDVCDGAVEEGFRTLVVCERGRDAPYTRYFKATRQKDGRVIKGVVDEAIVLDKFAHVTYEKTLRALRERNAIFVPNRSLTSYAGVDAVESDFLVPLFGSRQLLRTEERTERKSYYWLLEKAKLPAPEKVDDPKDIDGLVIVKLPHKTKKLERGFFTAASSKEYKEKSEQLLKADVISAKDLAAARIEKYIVGPVFNFDFFYSPLQEVGERLELLGIDWRFETSLDGHVRLPADQQLALPEHERTPEYTVVGHNTATLRESSLNRVFEIAERYVKATREYHPPGIIGPFTLQTCIDKDLEPFIYDVAPRIGGGTNVHMSVGHPYGNALWRRTMSTGRRIALELRNAVEAGKLDAVVT